MLEDEKKDECYDCGQYEILNEFISDDEGSSDQIEYYCDDCYQLHKMFNF